MHQNLNERDANQLKQFQDSQSICGVLSAGLLGASSEQDFSIVTKQTSEINIEISNLNDQIEKVEKLVRTLSARLSSVAPQSPTIQMPLFLKEEEMCRSELGQRIQYSKEKAKSIGGELQAILSALAL